MNGADSKILPFEEAVQTLERTRKQGKRVVLCHGVFDLMHPGHILHFKAARGFGDVLVVTVTPDEFARKAPGRPYFNQRLRMETIASLEYVDYVVLNQWETSIETIRQLKPHVYVKGSDYRDPGQDVTGNIAHEQAAVEAVGGQLVYTDEESFSSSALINQFFRPYSPDAERYLKQIRTRYSADEIWSYIKKLESLSVLVVGEAIFDQYTYCRPMAKPPKDSIVASRYIGEECFAGGSAAIARHLANFCKQVTLITILGEDEYGLPFFKEKLARDNIVLAPLLLSDRPTIRKQRFLEPKFLTKMFELQYLNDEAVSAPISEKLRALFNQHVSDHPILMVADFGHGMIDAQLQQTFYDCKRFMALNTQTNSANMGFNPVNKYRSAHYVSIDEPELRLAARTKSGDLMSIAKVIKQELRCPLFMVSRGAEGSSLVTDAGDIIETPVFSNRVVDRTGAGDALFAITSALAYQKAPPDIIGFVGNCVGMIAVETVGNREPIDPVLLHKYMNNLLK